MRKVVVKTRTKEVNVFQQGHYFQGQNTKVLDVITRFFAVWLVNSIIVVREPSTDKIFTRFLTILLSLYNFTGIAAEAMKKIVAFSRDKHKDISRGAKMVKFQFSFSKLRKRPFLLQM